MRRNLLHPWRFLGLFLLGFFYCSPPLFAQTSGPKAIPVKPVENDTRLFVRTIDAAFEEKIVDLFAENQCEKVREVVEPQMLGQFRPSVLAIAAYCEVRGGDPETLLAEAERKDPSNDTIALVHARYVWKKDHESSFPLWRRLLLLARNPALKNLAQQYLNETIKNEEALPLNQPLTISSNFISNYAFEANPEQDATSLGTPPGSMVLGIGGNFNLQRATEFGSIGCDYSIFQKFYRTIHNQDLLANDLEVPVAFRVGDNEDLILRPFASFTTQGYQPYQSALGGAVQGVAYRSNYKQSVQGSIFVDHFSPMELQPQQGTHFRFEYNWEFYLPNWFIKYLATVEHVHASADTFGDANSAVNSNATLNYSHTDFSLQMVLERNFNWLIASLSPKVLVREDSDSSTYALTDSQRQASKRRQDLQVVMTPSLTFPLTGALQIYTWYEFNHTFSNFGPRDFNDYNIDNQTIGLGLRGFLSNF